MSEGNTFLKQLKEDSLEYMEDKNILFFKIRKKDYLNIAKYLKDHGFRRLLTLSAVDWIKDDSFEIFFILHIMNKNIYIKVSTRIPRRKNVKIESLSELWPNAALHEREVWEMSKKFKLKRKDFELGVEIEIDDEGILITDEFAEHMFYFTNISGEFYYG